MLNIHYKRDSLYPGRFSNEREVFLVSKFAISGNSAYPVCYNGVTEYEYGNGSNKMCLFVTDYYPVDRINGLYCVVSVLYLVWKFREICMHIRVCRS